MIQVIWSCIQKRTLVTRINNLQVFFLSKKIVNYFFPNPSMFGERVRVYSISPFIKPTHLTKVPDIAIDMPKTTQ